MSKETGGEAIIFVLNTQASVKTGFILSMFFFKKLGICHVRRPVSRDRRILIMEMEAGKSALHQSCCIFTTNSLTFVFVFRLAFLRFYPFPS